MSALPIANPMTIAGVPLSKKLTALAGSGIGVVVLERWLDAPWPVQVGLMGLAAVYIVMQGVVDMNRAKGESAATWKTTAARYKAEAVAAQKSNAELRAWIEKYGSRSADAQA